MDLIKSKLLHNKHNLKMSKCVAKQLITEKRQKMKMGMKSTMRTMLRYTSFNGREIFEQLEFYCLTYRYR